MSTQEIRERWEKVTPGDWKTWGHTESSYEETEGQAQYGLDILIGDPITGEGFQIVTEGDDGGGAFHRDEDAIACKHAPTDIATLLQRVEELEAALGGLEPWMVEWLQTFPEMRKRSMVPDEVWRAADMGAMGSCEPVFPYVDFLIAAAIQTILGQKEG